MTKLAVIGTGMMGSAIVSGVVRDGVIPASDIILCDAMKAKAEALAEKLGAAAAASNTEAIRDADAVLFAVKPQFLGDVINEIKGIFREDQLLLTIVAGVPMSRYSEELGAKRIVRIMPNTPAQIGQGICAWCTTEGVTPEQKSLAASILSALGEQSEVARESMLDIVTAVSGSGPAYVYLFIEAMIDAAVQMGMARPMAKDFVLQTVIGSAEYMKVRGEHPAILRNEVTSPGGTTAAALAVMEKEGLRTAITDGMIACLEKSLSFGKK